MVHSHCSCVRALTRRWPRLHLPYRVVYLLALLMEAVAQALRWLAGGRVVWVPLISRAEAATAAVTHFTKVGRTHAGGRGERDGVLLLSMRTGPRTARHVPGHPQSASWGGARAVRHRHVRGWWVMR